MANPVIQNDKVKAVVNKFLKDISYEVLEDSINSHVLSTDQISYMMREFINRTYFSYKVELGATSEITIVVSMLNGVLWFKQNLLLVNDASKEDKALYKSVADFFSCELEAFLNVNFYRHEISKRS